MYLVAEQKTAIGGEQGFLQRVLLALVHRAGGAWAWPQKPAKKHMRIVETMALGAKKQLLLVSCDGERFLVGTGADSVQTILRVGAEGAGPEMSGLSKGVSE